MRGNRKTGSRWIRASTRLWFGGCILSARAVEKRGSSVLGTAVILLLRRGPAETNAVFPRSVCIPGPGQMLLHTVEVHDLGHRFSLSYPAPQDETHGQDRLADDFEIFGVNHHIRSVCDGFADAGYRVVAPALFDRIEPGVELGYGQADIIASADALGGQGGEHRNVGIIGYCWGGALAQERSLAFLQHHL